MPPRRKRDSTESESEYEASGDNEFVPDPYDVGFYVSPVQKAKMMKEERDAQVAQAEAEKIVAASVEKRATERAERKTAIKKEKSTVKKEKSTVPAARSVPAARLDLLDPQRFERALRERMFCVARRKVADTLNELFKIVGSKGNVYTIEIGKRCSCNCPDRKTVCKHILFVKMLVLNIDPDSPWISRNQLTDPELIEIRASAPVAPVDRRFNQLYKRAATGEGADDSSLPGPTPLPAEGPVPKHLPEAGDACPICYEILPEGQNNALTFCTGEGGCGFGLHVGCHKIWSDQLTRGNVPITCIYCSALWSEGLTPVASPAKKPRTAVNSQYLKMDVDALANL